MIPMLYPIILNMGLYKPDAKFVAMTDTLMLQRIHGDPIIIEKVKFHDKIFG